MNLPISYMLLFLAILLLGLIWYQWRIRWMAKSTVTSILDLASISPLRHALPDLILEVARARRMSHILAVVIIRVEIAHKRKASLSGNIRYFKKNHQLSTHVRQLALQEFADCSRAFRDLLREVDSVAFDSVRDQFVVILPGADCTHAMETINRIGKFLGPSIANRMKTGIAEYPKDGLFLEDLIDYGMNEIEDNDSSADFDIEVSA